MNSWIRWKTIFEREDSADESWLLAFRRKIFKIVLLVGITFFSLIVIRSCFVGRFGYADLGNMIFFALLYFLVSWKPRFFRLWAWLGLLALAINTFDGMDICSERVVINSYILYPLLVLYGALIGDIWIAMTAMTGTTAIYLYIWEKHAPLNAEDLLTITNLIVIVLASGIAALAVWVQHKRLLDKLRKQSRELKYELDSNMRLHTLVFHDIINPLSVITTTAELTKTKGSGNQNELVIIHNMTRRIINTIDAARRMELGGIPETENISMIDLFNELKSAFGMKIDQKKLNLVFEGDKNINIITNRSLLCDSVLGNFLSNAVKFSERASTIKITASREQNNMVRISIIDSGNGFPIKLLQCVEQGKTYKSADGTEGEKGHAYGMMIAATCLRKLGGILEVRNMPEGGACVSALLSQE